MSQSCRRLEGSISARPRPSCLTPDPRMTAWIAFERTGKASRIRSRCARITSSTSSLANARTITSVLRGRHPSRRAASQAIRSYQPIWRSSAPRSSSRVLISMTRSVAVLGSNARRSIHPCDRPWTTSTSLAVDQPSPRSRRSTYAEHRAWTSSWTRVPAGKTGPRKENSISRPSALAIASTSCSGGLASPRSIRPM